MRFKFQGKASPPATRGAFQRPAYVAENEDYDADSDGPPGQEDDDDQAAQGADAYAAEAYLQESDDDWESKYYLADIPEEELLEEVPAEFWQDEECATAAAQALDTRSVYTASAVKLRGLMNARGFLPVSRKGKARARARAVAKEAQAAAKDSMPRIRLRYWLRERLNRDPG